MNQGICIILSAPSGGGKTSIIRELMSRLPILKHSISYTTRSVRSDKEDGKDYHFVTEDTFRKMVENGEFLEWAVVHGKFYGTSKHDLMVLLDNGYDVILDIDIQGSRNMRKAFQKGVHIFVMPPSMEVLENRLRSRGSENEEDLKKRLENARNEMVAYWEYDYVVINSNLESAVETIKSIVIAERARADRFETVFKRIFEKGDI
ncbi:guanylate kinase [bacterium]|nr:guanylate kinase [candidate division CSSED10-310 bacterium]